MVVRYPAERRRSLSELASERIHRPGGGELPLSLVASITEKREPATLTRIDGKRAARVNGRADTAVITPIQARREVRNQIIPDLLAKYPGLAVEVEAGARDEGDMLETLSVLVPIVLIAIYALIAAFLRSYWKPVIAVVGIPIAFAGAVVSHWILGWDLTTMSLFGMIAVGGVVVNDAPRVAGSLQQDPTGQRDDSRHRCRCSSNAAAIPAGFSDDPYHRPGSVTPALRA